MRDMYNIALLFRDEDARAFTAYSEEVNRGFESDFLLGKTSLPHITIIQIESEQEDVVSLWNVLEREWREGIAIQLAGLTLLPSREGHVWIEIAVLKSLALSTIQQRVLRAVGDRGEVRSGVEDAYRPHITIARALRTRCFNALRLDEDVLRRKGVVGRVGIGVSGANFQFERTLRLGG